MFGFQRVGNTIWAAADQGSRGFLLVATSGRTTPMVVIIDHGMREMLVKQKDVFYYLTLMNENDALADLPAGAEADVIRGCYKFGSYSRISDGGYGHNSLKKLS